MRRQMAHRIDGPSRRWPIATIVVVGVIAFVGLIGAMVIFGGQRGGSPASPPPSASSTHVAEASPSPAATSRQSVTPSPSAHSSATPGATSSPTTPIASPSQTPGGDIAPQSADQFDLHNQAINIGFPLRSDTDYHYRDNYLEKRAGPPDPYNHAKVGPDGQLIRLHDGIDIYAPENVPVLSPFDGTVIDPATRWQPWQPDRYGLTVVVQSDEPTSTGYMAVLVHLSNVWVDVGQHVTRGQVIGALGRTGDAQDVRPQLHIELRAPFLIDWSSVGEDRQVDAFNPYPSLVAADPKT
jgi:murein DD-endopeptidase MepM/ murein hydrolase activator NlpD